MQLYCDLEQTMQQQYELAALLLEETRKQNRALRKNDLAAINACAAALEQLGLKMSEIDKNREKITGQLTERLNLPPDAKLTAIAARAPEDLSLRLLHLRREIRRSLEELKEQVEFNSLLTRNALRFNNTVLGIFRQAAGATYGNSGQVKDGAGFAASFNKSV
ncbi:FlgN protein [Desulfotomaculum arcticum]|uniref:FlgN protein n=1 Tax=Desulfotruncus arcticus DSM 17038 TaxID=1121424 RepID=A0A1I2MWT3_9FIRM|nr:flagellar protein FlgN [Desulfotruncus arcticus]SFF95340.1 FlgN protein [Desulfotomaculum arcticum] [Desulfotruncus arcticus DSM 17038]